MSLRFDVGLYVLSIFVTMLCFFTAFVLTNDLRLVNKRIAGTRILLSGLCIGVGIWAAFLISVIALQLPVSIDIGGPSSFVPLFLAIISFLGSLYLNLSFANPRIGLFVSALLMNSGLICIYAFALNAVCTSRASVAGGADLAGLFATGFLFSCVALWFAMRRRGVVQTFAGAILIGGLGTALNFTGLLAFGPADSVTPPFAVATGLIAAQFYLALALAAAAYMICGLAVAVHYNQEFVQIPGPPRRTMLEDQRA
jgi:NO-binding membrane sensor protein with MHYT domain